MEMILDYLVAHAHLIGIVGYVVFSRARIMTYLHIFQQEEYDDARFLRWLLRSGSVDRTLSLIVAILWAVSAAPLPFAGIAAALAMVVAFFWIAQRDATHRKGAKKPLVMTARARRTFEIAWALANILALALAFSIDSLGVWLIAIHLCPLVLSAANLGLMPFEARVKQRFWREAHEKILSFKPFVIGITGSYGKTSVKHILGHILQSSAPTLITPGSVNTPMGISRIAREQLRVSHKYFVVEMGAYGIGSIRRLCELAEPQMGILTAIGAAHLERFRSTEVTARAKMELADFVIKRDGKMVINADTLKLQAVREGYEAHKSSFVVCGADIGFSNAVQKRTGIEFTIHAGGADYPIAAPLFGVHHAANITIAFAAARALGMGENEIAAAVKTLPQIAHRLEVKYLQNGATIIDDAYNSNPSGFESALETLRALKKDGARTYLITPGMVELGPAHDAEHERLGRLAGSAADVVFVVGAQRIPTFVEGARATGANKQITSYENFAAAYDAFLSSVKPDDVALIENDLPDLYERRLSL